MKFPDKLTPVEDSVIGLFLPILNILKAGSKSPKQLYDRVCKDSYIEPSQFVEALDCLYAIRQIDLITETEVLTYVGGTAL